MTAPSQSKAEAKEHARAVVKAAEYLLDLAKRGELPMTEGEFVERVERFYATLDQKLGVSNALLLAIIVDEPCPQALFRPWASVPAIWLWRNAETNPLPWAELNGKVMVKPSDFFAALKIHGKATP